MNYLHGANPTSEGHLQNFSKDLSETLSYLQEESESLNARIREVEYTLDETRVSFECELRSLKHDIAELADRQTARKPTP